MNGLYTWALSFTVCSFTVLIINYLFPKGNVKSTATVVLVLFCLVSVISPLKEIKATRIRIPDNSSTEAQTDSVITSAKTRLRLLTDDALKSIDIENYEIIIDISTKDNELIFNRFDVYIDESTKAEKAKNTITDKTGIEPEIYVLE